MKHACDGYCEWYLILAYRKACNMKPRLVRVVFAQATRFHTHLSRRVLT